MIRNDVHRCLLERGWVEEYPNGPLIKRDAKWASLGHRRESALGFGGDHPDQILEFSPLIPARVIVAACESAASIRVEVAA